MTNFLTDSPVTYRGMQLERLRQKYAGMAMQAIISNPKYYDECISIFNSGFTAPAEPYCRNCLDKVKADTMRRLFTEVFNKQKNEKK